MIDLSSLTTFVSEHKVVMWWIAVASAILFVGCLVVVPWLVVRIPADYFSSSKRPKLPFADRHPVLRWAGLIVKNVIGGVLVLAGIAMLVLPGQGILTLAMGVMLLNFPGKHRLERRIIRMKPVLKSINWLRVRSDVAPFREEDLWSDAKDDAANDAVHD